ncbi:MAG TPA: hypothetical protein VI322_01695 [Candidatus Saccharimonadia bacterium]
MNKRLRHVLLAGAAVASIGLGVVGAGIASADSSTGSGTSLIDKLATKFNLNRADVAAVFTADRQEHEAQRQADQAARLAQAVKDGKLTQAQAHYITNAQKALKTLMDAASPDQQTDAQRQAIRAKMDALRTWAQQNNVDLLRYVGPGGHGGFGGAGGFGGPGSPSN